MVSRRHLRASRHVYFKPYTSNCFVVSDCKPVVSLPDVEGEGVRLLRGRGDGERMPLKLGNRRNVEVDIVAGLEGEVGWALDDEVHHLGGEDDPGGDIALALRRNFWTSI